MFYCDACGGKLGWPKGLARSTGPCELCRRVAECSDVHSSLLPKPKSVRKPFNDRAGYVSSRRSGKDRGWVVVYLAKAQEIDVDANKYAVVCETHGTICGTNTAKDARVLMRTVEFCEECMAAVPAAPEPKEPPPHHENPDYEAFFKD